MNKPTITLAGIQTCVFLALLLCKITGLDDMAWIAVFSPLWIPWVIIIAMAILIIGFAIIASIFKE